MHFNLNIIKKHQQFWIKNSEREKKVFCYRVLNRHTFQKDILCTEYDMIMAVAAQWIILFQKINFDKIMKKKHKWHPSLSFLKISFWFTLFWARLEAKSSKKSGKLKQNRSKIKQGKGKGRRKTWETQCKAKLMWCCHQ